MPGEAVDGDTEGRGRDDHKESEESEDPADITLRKNSDSEVETSDEHVKDLRVKYELVNFEKVEEDDDDYDDADDWDYSDGEDSWFIRVQKKRTEEEKDYRWLSVIDKASYLKAMTPVYLLLEVRSASPLEVQHIRHAVSHLSRMWPWWGISVRHRGQDQDPRAVRGHPPAPLQRVTGPLCPVVARQPPTLPLRWIAVPWSHWVLCLVPCSSNRRQRSLQVGTGPMCPVVLTAVNRSPAGVCDGEYDEDEDSLWELMDQQQWRHTRVAEGALSSVTLINNPSFSAAAAAVAAAPHLHRNEDMIPEAADGASATTATPGIAARSKVAVTDVPGLPHTTYLILGIPHPFVDNERAEVISHTLITLLNDVLAGRIQGDYQPPQESGKDAREAEVPCLEAWLAERLQVAAEAKSEGGESNADPESGCLPDEENESDTRGYVQRTFDSVISRNFINRCKAERVSYVNGFAACVSSAAAAFLAAAEPRAGQRVVTRQRVCEHLHWPAAPLDWHDGDPDEEPPPKASNRPPGVTVTAPMGEDDSVFWETARYVSQKRWGALSGGRREAALHILHALRGEDSEADMPLQRYPAVSLRLCDIQTEECGAPTVQRCGDVAGLGPHALSPVRHFLITHTINLHLEEGSQVLSFSLHHSSLFLAPGAGRRFADHIERALNTCVRSR
ncbi:hypothetical protein GWK47_053516 [Chionoecetes opilio]|uniref:Uncharacterized protein n=1 Tax=Chionoecetes opilio TaxID=41210 RepID=A0A8J5CQP3_CHIOP|nr:hypothetical protein GWK47_053516 [Chionoecetes opilio]